MTSSDDDSVNIQARLLDRGVVSPYEDDDRAKSVRNSRGSHKIEDVGSNGELWTAMLVFKSYIGAGILSLPYAFAQGKFIAANALTLLSAFLSLYCIWLLLDVHSALPASVTSLEDIAQACFGGRATRQGRASFFAVQFALAFTQTGFSIAYVLFISQSIGSFVPLWDWRWFAVALVPLLYGLVLIKQLKSLGAIVALGFIAIMAALIAVVVYVLIDHRSALYLHLHDGAFLTQVDVANIPICLGLIVYVFEGIGLVVPLKKAMRRPQRFRRIISLSYVFMTLLFTAFPTVCYFALDNVSSGGIIADLPQFGAWAPLSIALKVVLSLALWVTYPVQMFPVLEIVENHLFTRTTPNLELKRNYVRFVAVIVTVLVAVLVPHFSLFMSLIGNLGSAMLMFVVPTVCHIRMFSGATAFPKLMFHVAIVLFGVVVAVIGTYMSVSELIAAGGT